MKLGIRAAADKELPQDHIPFDFSLLPDDKDEYIFSDMSCPAISDYSAF